MPDSWLAILYDILKYLTEENLGSFDTLRLFICGGAPVPGSLVQCAYGHGILLCECYGSTESCPHAFVPPEHCLEWDGAWSGIPFPGIEVRVVDADHRDVAHGEQGEEISRGPHQFVGYLNDRERTDRALDDDGWFYSGDLCYMDEAGRIRINGRKKEIIIRGGENICANEIDENLMECPGIGRPRHHRHATTGARRRICTFAVATGDRRRLADITGFLAENTTWRAFVSSASVPSTRYQTATGKVSSCWRPAGGRARNGIAQTKDRGLILRFSRGLPTMQHASPIRGVRGGFAEKFVVSASFDGARASLLASSLGRRTTRRAARSRPHRATRDETREIATSGETPRAAGTATGQPRRATVRLLPKLTWCAGVPAGLGC